MQEGRGEKQQLQIPGFDVDDPLCGEEAGLRQDSALAAGSRVLWLQPPQNQNARGSEGLSSDERPRAGKSDSILWFNKTTNIPILDLRASGASQYSYAFPSVLPSFACPDSITIYSTMKGTSTAPEHIVIKTCTCPVQQLGGRQFLTPKNFQVNKV